MSQPPGGYYNYPPGQQPYYQPQYAPPPQYGNPQPQQPYYPPQQQPSYSAPPPQQQYGPPAPVPCLDSSGRTGPQRLLQDQRIYSYNRSFSVVLQNNGAVATYTAQNSILWSSPAANGGVPPYVLQAQDDGNLVVYDSQSRPHWSTGAHSSNAQPPVRVVMGDDGTLVLLNSANTQLWTSLSVSAAPAAAAPPQPQYGGAPPQQQQYGAPAPQPQQQYYGVQPSSVPGASMDSSGQSAPAVLQQDQSLSSGSWHFSMQADGNLVLYENSQARWASHTTKKKDIFSQLSSGGDQAPPYRLALQDDGNLALYEAHNRMLWSSQSSGRGQSPFIVLLQGDGSVTLTDKTGWMTWKLTPQGPQLFDRPKLRNILCSAGQRGPQQLNAGESLLSPSGKYELCMQDDGHLVTYEKATHRVCWKSGTANKGKHPRRCVVQPDGNFCVYDAGNTMLWSSKTNEHPEQGPFALLLQDNSAMELFNASNNTVWTSGNSDGSAGMMLPPQLTVGYAASLNSGGSGSTAIALPPKPGIEGVIHGISSFLDKPNPVNLVNIVAAGSGGKLSTEKIIAGMKEALRVGIDTTIKIVGVVDGFLLNMMIRILLPPKLAEIADVLKKFFSNEIREFEVSMNRAAERASSTAIDIFVQAIMAMNFQDVMGVFKGGDTAITEWFSNTCRALLYASFFPIVRSAMNEFSVTRIYQDIVGKYNKLPLVKKVDVNIEEWVVTKALDGLFLILGQQETAIRKNPAARITDILKEVFAGFENPNRP